MIPRTPCRSCASVQTPMPLAWPTQRKLIRNSTVRPADLVSRADWGTAFAEAIRAHDADLVVSAGPCAFCQRTSSTSSRFSAYQYAPRTSPAVPGAHAVRDALAAGATETGVTVHIIDEGVDTGPVLRQAAVQIAPGGDRSRSPRAHQAGLLTTSCLPTPFVRSRRARFALPRSQQPTRRPSLDRKESHGSSEPGPELYEHRDRIEVRRALISVSDKTRLTELAAALNDAGVEIVSTGSTASTIRDTGIPVTDVKDVTGSGRGTRRPREDPAPRCALGPAR